MIHRLRILTPALLTLLLADCATKELAEAHLTPAVPLSVWGDALQFTLVYNPGAAFGIALGEYNRLVFTGLALIDRLRSHRGVVDFIDVGVGDTRFWIFNLADVGVTVGAILVAYTIWREDQPSDTELLKS